MLKSISAAALALALVACGGGSGGTTASAIPPDKPINSAQAQTAPAATSGLVGVDVINTGPFFCDQQMRQFSWSSPYAKPLRVLIARQWVGLDYGMESDSTAQSFVIGPGGEQSVFVMQQIDNYKVRSFEQDRWVNFGPSWITIPAGGRIMLNTLCNAFNTASGHMHVAMTIWFYAE